MRTATLFTIAILLTGCSPAGANWVAADFNKYDRNYAAFPTAELKIGMSKAEAQAMFGANMKVVSADKTTETYMVERWVSVPGPDYVGERLLLRFNNDALSDWKIDSGSVTTVAPRAW